MIHVETQPLSHTLHQVDEVCARWIRVLNDPRWITVCKSVDALPRVLRFSEPHAGPVKLCLKGDGAQLLVVLDPLQWPSMRVVQQLLDERRKDAVVNLWAHHALHQLRAIGCEVDRCQWVGDTQLRPAARVSVQWRGYVVDLYPEPASARFVDGLQSFLTTLEMPMSTRLAQWPLATSVTLGERSFSLSRIEALKVGDWVLWGAADCVVLRVHGAASASGFALVAACQLSTKELTMEEALHEEVSAVAPEEALQSLTTEDVTETVQSTYAGLQVHVRFEIDGPAMTVAQATSLVPGEVLVLPTSVDQSQIRLRCQGRCFAYGELVNVGGQMGVRIIEVGGHDV